MTNKIGIAVIGCGYIGTYHARAIQSAAGAELVAAVDPDAQRRDEFGRALGLTRLLSDPAELLTDPAVDAVVVAVPNALHKPLANSFLEVGKHVLVEKPMALDTEEAQQMAKLAHANDLRLLVGHMWRFDPEAQFLRNAIVEGLLGRVIKTKGYGIHALWGPSGWFTERAKAGGGALADMGVHAIDTVRYILGDPAPQSVYARIGTYYGNYDVDDSGILMIEWEGGTTSIIESGWWQPQMSGPEAATEVYGTKGYGRIFPSELRLKIAGLNGVFTPKVPERTEHCAQFIYDGQMQHFVNCIKRGKNCNPGPDHGLAIMKIVDAAYRSAESGAVEPVV